MRTLIIHNTASGAQSDDIYAFERALIQPGDEIVMRTTVPNGDVAELLRDAASFDAVVASGGDGTVADVAYAVRSSNIPVLVFPSGTANLLANNIGNACEPAALAATLRNGKRVCLDMCELEYTRNDGVPVKRGFLNMAGAGYDASIMQGSSGLKARFGQLAYYLAALGNLDPGVSRFRLSVDGAEVWSEGICVLVANWGSIYQGVEFVPGSSPTDGLLDLAVLSAKNSVELLPALVGGMLRPGEATSYPNIDFYHAREVTVECDPPFPMQYDGEVVEHAATPFTARVIPRGFCTVVDALSPLSKL